MAERSHGVRVSVSNLFKNFQQSNGFVAQVPLELKNNCWSVVVLDLYEILRRSGILPSTYMIDGSY
jgi:WD repeat-containing protein 90